MPVSPPTQMEEKWHEQAGLTITYESRMAYAIIARSPLFAKSEREYKMNYKLFYSLWFHKPRTQAGVESPLVSWRFPGTNLSLLQLAAICDNVTAVRVLAGKGINPGVDEEPGENHPLHLAYAYGRCSLVNLLQRIFKGFTFKAGSVTIAPNPCLTPEAPVVHLEAPLHGSCLDLALENKHMSLVFHLVPDYFSVLEGANLAPAIECLWLTLDHLYENGQLGKVCLSFLVNHSGQNSEVNDNLFLLCCQLLNAHNREETNNACSKSSRILKVLVWQAVYRKRLDLLTREARHCTQAQLHQAISFLEGDTHSSGITSIDCPHHFLPGIIVIPREEEAVLKVFQDEKEGRTLQHEAMLTILRSVGGDARRAKTLSDLPEPLLELFPVPFKDLHERLTGSTQ